MAGLVRVALFGAILAAVALGGYVVGAHRIFPYSQIRGLEHQARGIYHTINPKEEPTVREDRFESIFLRLKGQSAEIPVAREGDGGGLASFGEDVVLVTHEGGVFAARSASDIAKVDTELPENGFDAYMEFAASDAGKELIHYPGSFRYNAVIRYAAGDDTGLALSYTEYDPEKRCYVTAVALLPVAGSQDIRSVVARAGDWRVVFRTEPCLPLKSVAAALEGHMAGGRLAFKAPGLLYLGSGDYSWDGVSALEALSQDPGNSYGKVIEIDLATGASRQVSRGHRNMQGVTVDREGRVWVVEHGVRGGDELNLVREGADYGWPVETLGTSYNKTPWPMAASYGHHDRFEAPVFAWIPSVATSALTVVQGFDDSWDGDLLVGSLRNESLHRVRVQDDRVLFAERIAIGERIRDVHQHSDGRIVFWTDSKRLYFLEPADATYMSEYIDKHIAGLGYDDSDRARIATAVDACMECHDFNPGGDVGAPGLGAIFEAKMGSGSFADYSEAMKAASGVWTRERLLAFIEDPASVVPGTSMPAPPIEDPFVAEEVVNLLVAIKMADEE